MEIYDVSKLFIHLQLPFTLLSSWHIIHNCSLLFTLSLHCANIWRGLLLLIILHGGLDGVNEFEIGSCILLSGEALMCRQEELNVTSLRNTVSFNSLHFFNLCFTLTPSRCCSNYSRPLPFLPTPLLLSSVTLFACRQHRST